MTDQEPGQALAFGETEVVLRDGTALRMRPVRPGDEEALVAFYRGLSRDSLLYRFFTPVKEETLGRWVRKVIRGQGERGLPPSASRRGWWVTPCTSA